MREALIQNLKGLNPSSLKSTIEDGISSKEDTILVGLGVLFELYYKSLDESSKDLFINNLSSLI